jgi:hypothetical protein
LNLIDVAKNKGKNERVKAYWNTYHCQNEYITSNGKIYTNYCKNRFCTSCTAIRKADIINRYYPALSKWEDPHFLTLTIKSIPASSLSKYIDGMQRGFKIVLNRCKKRHQRGNGTKPIGIKSLECNFNPIKRTYNPHFHILVPSREIANMLKVEWLKQWKSDKKLFAWHKGQHIRPVKNLELDLIETIKYGSKIFTSPELKKKARSSIPPMVYVNALDNIFAALRGKRIFDRFGFNLELDNSHKTEQKFITDYKRWNYDSKSNDWVSEETGEALTGYLQPTDLEYLLNNCINKRLE